jgi:drug/metabolite transporter (DMT)-like permease
MAALLMCSATFCFAILDSSLKALVTHHGIAMLVTMRVGVQMVLMLALVPWLGRRVVHLKLPAVQFGRGVALIAGSALGALAFRYMTLAQTSAIGFSAPLIAAVIAAAVFGERLHWRQLACILVGFFGIIAALDPSAPSFGPVLVFPLAQTFANAMLHVLTRVGRSEDPLASVMWSAAAATAIALCALPWTFEPLPWPSLLIVIGGGTAGTLGQLLMVEAFRRAPTAVVSPISYTQFVWTAVAGAVLFGELPSLGVIIGAVVVAVSGIALVRWATPQPPTGAI